MWRRKKDKVAQDEAGSGSGSGSGPGTQDSTNHSNPVAASVAPPAYTAQDATHSVAPDDFSTLITNLTLSPSPIPTEDACLAHLRLLKAFERLKTEMGYREGLWDLFDCRAKAAPSPASNNGKAAAAAGPGFNEDVLVKIREKRWAVYVARAVDRYVAWWKSFVPDMLQENDMIDPDQDRKDRYEGFVKGDGMVWNGDMLPPLDVLMVWHAHMLNPRLYLEDCIRYGHGTLWAAGMPWQVVNAAIQGPTFQYVASNECVAQWTARTDLAWRNEDDPDTKDVKCPVCAATVTIPWTTCGQAEDYQGTRRPGIVGEGLADGQLSHQCPSCAKKVTHESLRISKFRADLQASITQDHAIPGTILDLKTGIPKLVKYDDDSSDGGCPDQLFPARLARRGLLVEVVEMLKPESSVAPSMMAVRNVMEENFTGRFADSKNLRELMDRHGHKKVTEFRLSLDGRRQTRKMMSRYWENASPLSIDLVGCVMRQGAFTEKMCKRINWLSFPNARTIVAQLIQKYTRFIEIVAIAAATKDKVAVPTLDVDLAWHTHQLSPQSYYNYSVLKTEVFVDHNDKVDEDRLSTAFEWTCKTYQDKFGEIYSECKCWYCETVRVMALPVTKMFGLGKEEKLLEAWHESPQAKDVPIAPAAESAHVSSHPAVHTNETTARRVTTRPLRLEYRNRLEVTHSKARKRANKTFKVEKGKRMGPRGEDTTRFWGKNIQVDGPWASGMAAASTSAIYPSPPGFVHTGPGSVGSCATGTCGGATGCGSETLGLCSAGCVGSAWFGGKAGCVGFGDSGSVGF
ncbi:alpha-ketoglutarate-dependent sulfonate dioxygenase [Colletotrichum truncatum]|uniref:Alpha-ketoglutarate-dependent sulfonate dioxygenase n=1 Tax=Colletotrichum truncatum TaxID=5467 RepID=A0ACC3Z6U8_COLTU|nr:alpha-ketoglutarate-dependent sulfonate dioxygenase [Colletotrichum truncatum]KAF6787955.1 alpha-ketoglutarate-dependent sulfonate dioxygenase [Colletotrichum truncatum]